MSNRGLGTQNRTDPVFIGLQKTRLLDPTLNFLGTNDQPGDYRIERLHRVPRRLRQRPLAGALAGRTRRPATRASQPDRPDEMIPKDESGHPIEHVLTNVRSRPASA